MAVNECIKYDPNIQWGSKTFRLRFSQWRYETTMEVSVGGNCHAMSNLDAALGVVLDGLPFDEDEEAPVLLLTAPNGDTLKCHDEFAQDEDWLMDMLVSAEVIRQEPEAKRPSPPQKDTDDE